MSSRSTAPTAGVSQFFGSDVVGPRADEKSWLFNLAERRNANVAPVALANKTARTVWARLAHEQEFQVDHAADAATA